MPLVKRHEGSKKKTVNLEPELPNCEGVAHLLRPQRPLLRPHLGFFVGEQGVQRTASQRV